MIGRSSMRQFLPVLLVVICLEVTLLVGHAQNAAMDRGDAQRSRVLSTVGPAQVPETLVWKSEKLFTLRQYFPERAEAGPFQFDIPTGHGYSFPIISGGVIFFTVDTGISYFHAIDAPTGKQLVLLKFEKNRLSSPAALGRIAFFGSVTGRVYAYDVDRQDLKWTFKETSEQSFAETSPAIDGGVLYFFSPGAGLYALDTETGELKWKFVSTENFSGPVIGDDSVILLSSNGTLISIDKKSGTKKWEAKVPRDTYAPAILSDQIFTVHTYGEIRALSLKDGALRWKVKKYGGANGSPALLDKAVFFAGREDSVIALQSATGLEKWRFKTNLPCGPPIIATDVVYASCKDKRIYALDAETGQEKWRYENRKGPPPIPTFSNGVMYALGGDGLLYALK